MKICKGKLQILKIDFEIQITKYLQKFNKNLLNILFQVLQILYLCEIGRSMEEAIYLGAARSNGITP